MVNSKSSNYKKRIIINSLKILILLVIIFYILFYINIDFAKVLKSLSSISLSYIILLFIFALLVEYTQSPIIQALIKPYNIYIKASYIYKVNIISMFYNNFMPLGIITGGLARLLKLSKENKKKKEIFTAIVLQNILNLLFFSLFGAFVIIYNNPLGENYAFISYMLSIALTLFIIIFLLTLVNSNIQVYLYDKIVSSISKILPKSLNDKLITMWNTIFTYKAEQKAIYKAFSYSIIYKMGHFLLYYFIALTLGINISFFELSSLFIVSNFITYIPLPLSGLGTRELAFINLCAFYNIEQEYALLYSLLIFSFTILLSIFGALLEITEHSKSKRAV